MWRTLFIVKRIQSGRILSECIRLHIKGGGHCQCEQVQSEQILSPLSHRAQEQGLNLPLTSRIKDEELSVWYQSVALCQLPESTNTHTGDRPIKPLRSQMPLRNGMEYIKAKFKAGQRLCDICSQVQCL